MAADPAPLGPPRRVLRQNLKDDVAAHVRELVFAAVLRPGMRVDQDAIAARLGTSKVPVREALIVLEAEGLVESYPNRGAFIAELTPDDINDNYLAVGQISAIAAARTATRITDEELARLRELLDLIGRGHDPGASHHEFHRMVNTIGGSRRLGRVLRSLSHAIPERLHFAERGGLAEVTAEHLDLLVALEARNPEQAAAATLAHFTNGADHAVAVLEERGFWGARPVSG